MHVRINSVRHAVIPDPFSVDVIFESCLYRLQSLTRSILISDHEKKRSSSLLSVILHHRTISLTLSVYPLNIHEDTGSLQLQLASYCTAWNVFVIASWESCVKNYFHVWKSCL